MKENKLFKGRLHVELTSADIFATLKQINNAGIDLNQMELISEVTCRFEIKRKYLKNIENICRKRGETLRILRKSGMYWIFKNLQFRPILVSGIVFLLSAVIFIPSRVFFIEVNGNIGISSQEIISAAEACGIYFGASRREVRSEQVKNALLSELPQLQWAGINTKGCVAVISVRERLENDEVNKNTEISDIIAERDGHILSGTATRGNPLFRIGESVKKGQILISGYTDCGGYVQATRAEGEVFAQTLHAVETITPVKYLYRTETKRAMKKISLILRKKRINLWKDSGISDATCGRMYKEYHIILPGGFRLPVTLCVETYTCYAHKEQAYPLDIMEGKISRYADEYLTNQMVAGLIQSKNCEIIAMDHIYHFLGEYICIEMIGREKRIEFGDTNGKDN